MNVGWLREKAVVFGWRKTKAGKRGEPLPEDNEGPPDSNRPGGLCPRCEKQSSFEEIGALPLTFDGGRVFERDGTTTPTHNERATVLVCRHCHQGVLVVEEQWTGEHRSRERQGGGAITWRGFYWWPLVGATLHEAVPATVRSAFHEAATALSANCSRASAVMARSALEAIARDQGETKGNSLAAKLQSLAARGLLLPTLAEWAKEVRLIANDAAHDPLSEVSIEDARQLVTFIGQLADYIYVMPFQIKQRRAEKSERDAGKPD